MRGSERYIEVKGHGKGGEGLSIPEEQFNFGKEKGEKYWLYIVWYVLEGRPVLVAFRDPYNRDDLSFRAREKEVVIRKKVKVYELSFE